MTFEINEAVRPDADGRMLIGRHLFASNLARMPELKQNAFRHALYLKDMQGEVIGGLWAERAFDWVFVDLLFVPEALRGQGVGADLMARIETRARDWNCRGVWLDTYGFQSRGFYERVGYTCFATLDSADPQGDKHLMRKYLD